ncbi:hypothetical protein FTUN_6379 [Frigoriglobus tundricola]|uniref:Uncharacterized protein n=1 Tax=Frigoriglobus tundricola TaxID=2774151 RepID=A0A6M5YZ18_9BACT|nr:hypothetical protein FTUN_6379 [Frigoriglobus tundricola]
MNEQYTNPEAKKSQVNFGIIDNFAPQISFLRTPEFIAISASYQQLLCL